MLVENHVYVSDRPSELITNSLCMLETVYVSVHSVRDHLSLPIDRISMSDTVNSKTDSMWLILTGFFCHSQSVYLTHSLSFLQIVCVYHRQSVSVTDSLCLS